MSDALSGDGRSDETGEEKQDTQEKEVVIPERAEEAKLKAKYPSLGLQKPGGSDFLMKRLQKGVLFHRGVIMQHWMSIWLCKKVVFQKQVMGPEISRNYS
ncbi:alpha-endosulfine isoform X4 [Paroedura picta]|uniref:alpha-endosulfine isoform X4 n=1 Tax=Paroedura picta TaxID=143630 RepID=UPI004055F5F6